MQEISKKYAKDKHLKEMGIIKDTDMSKIILKLERLKENRDIKYYCMEFIIFNPVRDVGEIEVSLWGYSK
jgi:hypothetical protein